MDPYGSVWTRMGPYGPWGLPGGFLWPPGALGGPKGGFQVFGGGGPDGMVYHEPLVDITDRWLIPWTGLLDGAYHGPLVYIAGRWGIPRWSSGPFPVGCGALRSRLHWYQVLGTKYLVPSTWYQVRGTKYLVPSTWYQVGYIHKTNIPNVRLVSHT